MLAISLVVQYSNYDIPQVSDAHCARERGGMVWPPASIRRMHSCTSRLLIVYFGTLPSKRVMQWCLSSNRARRFTKLLIALLCCLLLVDPKFNPDSYRNVIPFEESHAKSRTLIVYVIGNPDPMISANVQFFLDYGVREELKFFFVFVVQSGHGVDEFVSTLLPKLPSNSKLVRHKNECYDIGTVGWLLFESKEVDTAMFEYFIWMNPSVRGPFLPSWIDSRDWPSLFTDPLGKLVKLSGTVVSCGGIVDKNLGARTNPHLQSYLLATDMKGLKILKDANVFRCYNRYTEVIYHAELGASLAILKAGFNLHSMMMRYKNVDWRDSNNWNCNGNVAPHTPEGNNGSSIDPLEVVFVKLKAKQQGWESSKRALAYSEMMEHSAKSGCVACNSGAIEKRSTMFSKLKAFKILFDSSFYAAQSRDLRHLDESQLWDHFVESGVFEQRPFALHAQRLRREFPSGVPNLEPVYEFLLEAQNL